MYLTSIHSKGFQSWKRLIKYANVKFSPGQKASKRSGVGIRCWLCTQQRRNWSVTPHQGVVRVQCQRSFLICALEHRVRNALLHLEQALRHGWMESDKHSADRKTQLWPGLLCTHWEFSPCFACTEETKVYGCNSIPTLILQDFMTFPNLEWLCIDAFITNMIWYLELEHFSILLTSEQEQWPGEADKISGLCWKFPFSRDSLFVFLLSSGGLRHAWTEGEGWGCRWNTCKPDRNKEQQSFQHPAEMKNCVHICKGRWTDWRMKGKGNSVLTFLLRHSLSKLCSGR